MKGHARYTHSHRPAGGYSMVELLIAMGIFAIGFVSLAAMFPAAVQMQKRTMEDVVTKLVVEQARAVGPVVGIEDSGSTASTVIPVTPNTLSTVWPLSERSYPTAIPVPANRDYFLVPVARRRADLSKWEVITFILKREGNADYSNMIGTVANPDDGKPSDGGRVPKVVGIAAAPAGTPRIRFNFDNDRDNNGIADEVRMGDMIVDSNGTTYVVQSSDAAGCAVNSLIVDVSGAAPNGIWYGRPPTADRVSPTRDIVSFLVNAKPPACEVVIDNNGNLTPSPACTGTITGSTVVPSDWNSFTPGWGDNAYLNPRGPALVPPNGAQSTFKWRVTGLQDGSYDLYATWVPGVNRSTTVTYGGVGVSGSANHRIAPNQDKRWNNTGPYFEKVGQAAAVGGVIEVHLTGKVNSSGTEFVIADAIILQHVP